MTEQGRDAIVFEVQGNEMTLEKTLHGSMSETMLLVHCQLTLESITKSEWTEINELKMCEDKLFPPGKPNDFKTLFRCHQSLCQL
jgi:hypothetical protein